MIKNILACTDGSAYGDTACQYAIDLAKRLQARLLGLHVLDSRALEGPLLADVANWVGAQPYGSQRFSFHKIMEEKGNAILDAFEQKCRQSGLDLEKIMIVGHPVMTMLREEGRGELMVVGRQGEHAELSDDPLGSSVDRLVRRSVNPCLVTPAEFKSVQNILAAYDGSGHGGRALQTAAWLAQTLPAELTVITAGKDNETTQAVLAEGRKRLAAYGMDTVPVLCPDKSRPEKIILREAADRRSDLIVAGTHGHSRIHERLLGGISHHLLHHAATPLLMVR